MSKGISIAVIVTAAVVGMTYAAKVLCSKSEQKHGDSCSECTDKYSKINTVLQEAVKSLDEIKATATAFCSNVRDILSTKEEETPVEQDDMSEREAMSLADEMEPEDYKEN